MAFYHGKNFGLWLHRVCLGDETTPNTLVCLYTLATGRFKLGFKTYIGVTPLKKEGENRTS